MITLFRRIREKLIGEGNIRRYLLYAVGEIALVVIGILLALQINTLNEQQKRSDQESYLILELKKEVEDNLILIEEDIMTNQAGLNGTIGFLKLLQDRGLEDHKDKADSLIVHLYYINTFEPVSGIIDDIVTTGKLDLIRDDSLRKEMANWAGRNIDLYDDIEIRNNYLFNTIIPFVSKYYPLIDTRDVFGDIDLNSPLWNELKDSEHAIDIEKMYSKEMEAHLYNHAMNQEYVINGTRIYQEYIKSLLNKIDEQLKTER